MKILVMLYFLVMKGVLFIDFNNISPDDTNYDEDDPETIIPIRLLAWHIKSLKKELNEELVFIVLHPKRWGR